MVVHSNTSTVLVNLSLSPSPSSRLEMAAIFWCVCCSRTHTDSHSETYKLAEAAVS